MSLGSKKFGMISLSQLALPYMNERGCKKHKKLLGRHVYVNARGGKKYVKSVSRHVSYMNGRGRKQKKKR